MPHTPHPAIQRGHYEVATIGAERIGVSGESRILPPVSILVRVVDFDADLGEYLAQVAPKPGETPTGLHADEVVRLAAPLLRDGLLDPGNGRKAPWLPPVQMVLEDGSLRFVQVVACLN